LRSLKHVVFPPTASGDEQWADIIEKPTADETQRAQKSLRGRLGSNQEIEGVFEFELLMVKEWHVADEEGNWLPLTRAGLGKAPGEIVTNLLFMECLEVLKVALPNS
jgi:hypothetical protein